MTSYKFLMGLNGHELLRVRRMQNRLCRLGNELMQVDLKGSNSAG
jgi:hypothetical protein